MRPIPFPTRAATCGTRLAIQAASFKLFSGVVSHESGAWKSSGDSRRLGQGRDEMKPSDEVSPPPKAVARHPYTK
jgi:hypothetical protein